MLVKRFITSGKLKTNTYVVSCNMSKRCVVIDPGSNCIEIMDYIAAHNIQMEYIINTHAHHDHCSGNFELYNLFKPIVLLGEKDRRLMKGIIEMKLIHKEPEPDYYLHDGDMLKIGNLNVSILETPGHTEGSISMIIGEAMFTGDLITCREEENRFKLIRPLNKKSLESLQRIAPYVPSNGTIYPGHGRPMETSYLKQLM